MYLAYKFFGTFMPVTKLLQKCGESIELENAVIKAEYDAAQCLDFEFHIRDPFQPLLGLLLLYRVKLC